MTFSPRIAVALALMIGFLIAWNTILPALAVEWIAEARNRASDR